MLYSIAFSEPESYCKVQTMKAFNVNLGAGFSETKLTREPCIREPTEAYPAEPSGGIPLSPCPATATGGTTPATPSLSCPASSKGGTPSLSPIPPAPRAGHPLSLLSPPIPPAAMAAPLPLSPSQSLSRHWHWRFKLPASVNGGTHVKNEPPL